MPICAAPIGRRLTVEKKESRSVRCRWERRGLSIPLHLLILRMAYQSFDDHTGSSKSADKLVKLKLPGNLSGASVLDIGCNEGFFCDAVLKRGAARVVGIDRNAEIVERARKQSPGG